MRGGLGGDTAPPVSGNFRSKIRANWREKKEERKKEEKRKKKEKGKNEREKEKNRMGAFEFGWQLMKVSAKHLILKFSGEMQYQ